MTTFFCDLETKNVKYRRLCTVPNRWASSRNKSSNIVFIRHNLSLSSSIRDFIKHKCSFEAIIYRVVFPFNVYRSTTKMTTWIGKLGSGISKMWIIFAAVIAHVTAHAQWAAVTVLVKKMWSDWVTHNSGTNNCRMLKIVIKSNQITLFYSAPKSWPESWPT